MAAIYAIQDESGHYWSGSRWRKWTTDRLYAKLYARRWDAEKALQRGRRDDSYSKRFIGAGLVAIGRLLEDE